MRSLLKLLRRLIPNRSPIRLAWHHAKAFVAALINGFPARRLTVIGVTGTDGKTTTVSMITHILQHANHSVATASTAFLQINNEREENTTHLTSLTPFALQKFLSRAVKNKCEYAVVEVSSHGLVQGRNNWMYLDVAAITNTSPEHLDYHGTMEQYIQDKGILFHMLKGRGTKVLNGSDKSFDVYQKIVSEETIVWEGALGDVSAMSEADLKIANIEADERSVQAQLRTNLGGEANLKLSIPGVFNLENALCAIGCVMAVGIPLEECLRALETFVAPPGRLEKIEEGQDFLVFVDFTMTPAAYEKTLLTLREMVGQDRRVLVMCSACGNRMKEKRPDVGRVCSECADVVVVTEDETYGEDPMKVLEEVWNGVKQDQTDAHKIIDRREAITFLLKHALPGDAVVFCGMGPFTTMKKLTGEIPWDEREIVKEELRAL